MDFDIERLIDMALLAKSNSYAPYSKFKVGCAILLNNGNYILGTNIENKSYSLTICAERSALFSLYSQGYTKSDIKAICITANTEEVITPCGACREVLKELILEDTPIVLTNHLRYREIVKINDLLPLSFKLEN